VIPRPPDRTAARRRRRTRRVHRAALVLIVGVGLAGCGAASQDLAADLGALGVGTAVGAATGNPAIGIAAGIGARVAADEGYRYGERRYYRRVQSAIAGAGGAAEPGELVYWAVDGLLGIGSSRGRIEVVRAFGGRLRCKELVFTVEPATDDAPSEARAERGGGPETDPDGPAPSQQPAEPLPEGSEVLTTTICEGPEGWAWAGARPSTTRWGGLQ